MTYQSIAIVFGPTLLKPEKETCNIAVHTVYQNQIVELILLELNAVFGRWTSPHATGFNGRPAWAPAEAATLSYTVYLVFADQAATQCLCTFVGEGSVRDLF